MIKRPDDFDEWVVYKCKYKTLVEPGFTLSYTKARYDRLEEGAAFRLEGRLKTPRDRCKAALFIGEALGDPTMLETSRFIDSEVDYLDVHRDFDCPSPEGYDDGWFKD